MLRQFVARHCVTFSVAPSLVRILFIDLYSIFILSTIHEILYIIKILLPGVLLIASMEVFAETSIFTAMDVEVPNIRVQAPVFFSIDLMTVLSQDQ
jgi:hypothetical protein